MACGLGNCTLNARRRTAPAALGRFHDERALGLPMAEKSVGGVLPSLTIQKGKSKMSTWSKDELRKNSTGTARFREQPPGRWLMVSSRQEFKNAEAQTWK